MQTNIAINEDSYNYFFEKAKILILTEYLKNELVLPEDKNIAQQISNIFENSDLYQVIIYDRYRLDEMGKKYTFADLLSISSKMQNSYTSLTIDNYNIIVLKGDYGIRRLESVLMKYDSNMPPQVNSPLDSFFISCGRIVNNANELSVSYNDALSLLHRRFFCDRHQHFVSFNNDNKNDLSISDEKSYQDLKTLEKYTQKFVVSIQSYNRENIKNLLNELTNYLNTMPLGVPVLKNWLLDLYLGIKEKIAHFYQSSNIPFISNSGAIQYILNSNYLYEIIDFLYTQFEIIMNSTGHFTRDSIIDVILNYIDHNYSDSITLEGISPTFGYNSSYLGKVFTEKTGKSFHTYLDDVRIEKAKELLTTTPMQVYRIAKQVGYSNVDYFHIKFKKKIGMSPAAYRKQNITT